VEGGGVWIGGGWERGAIAFLWICGFASSGLSRYVNQAFVGSDNRFTMCWGTQSMKSNRRPLTLCS